ncbi:hypothetical protein G6F31_019659 [Rhizopus arrhizus]|nr:hypothetical protein G6F31_019659 [Rhizopus arrhizus]
MNTPEQEAERIARAKEFVESIQADKDGECKPCNGMGFIDGVGDRCQACNGDGGDCAKGEGDNLVQQFIDATDALLASQERKTWTSGYKKELTAGERIRIAERWRQIRAALDAHRSPDADGGGRA